MNKTQKGMLCRMAVETIESVCNEKRIEIKLSYKAGKTISRYHRNWKIDVMSQTFVSPEFTKVVQEAMQFLLGALYQKKKKQPTQ